MNKLDKIRKKIGDNTYKNLIKVLNSNLSNRERDSINKSVERLYKIGGVGQGGKKEIVLNIGGKELMILKNRKIFGDESGFMILIDGQQLMSDYKNLEYITNYLMTKLSRIELDELRYKLSLNNRKNKSEVWYKMEKAINNKIHNGVNLCNNRLDKSTLSNNTIKEWRQYRKYFIDEQKKIIPNYNISPDEQEIFANWIHKKFYS